MGFLWSWIWGALGECPKARNWQGAVSWEKVSSLPKGSRASGPKCEMWSLGCGGRRGQGKNTVQEGEERSGWQTHHQWASTDRRASCFLTRNVSLKAPHQLPRAHSLRTAVHTGSVSKTGLLGVDIWYDCMLAYSAVFTQHLLYTWGLLGGIGTKWKQVPWAWVSKRRSDTQWRKISKVKKVLRHSTV